LDSAAGAAVALGPAEGREDEMIRDRRGFLSWLASGTASAAIFCAAQRSRAQNPRTDPRPKEDPAEPPVVPAKAVLKENEKDIKKDIEKLYQLASELKAEVEKTDSSQVLSLAMVRKAEEIEKLAKEIKNRARG
jgi:hypothetical protein